MQATDDGFLGHRLKLLQPKKGGFRAGVDSVFLAASVPALGGEAVVEAGTGPGVAACCFLHRVPGARFTGLEREAESVALAQENLSRNGLDGQILQADMQAPLPLLRESFRHGFANPPWFDEKAASLSPHALKARAHAAHAGTLEGWVAALAGLIEPEGSLTFILPAGDGERAAAAFAASGFGRLRLLPLAPRAGEAAIRVIVQGWKGVKGEAHWLKAFVLHGPGHEFTGPAQAILRDGGRLQVSE